jgi:hypothetical protein
MDGSRSPITRMPTRIVSSGSDSPGENADRSRRAECCPACAEIELGAASQRLQKRAAQMRLTSGERIEQPHVRITSRTNGIGLASSRPERRETLAQAGRTVQSGASALVRTVRANLVGQRA